MPTTREDAVHGRPVDIKHDHAPPHVGAISSRPDPVSAAALAGLRGGGAAAHAAVLQLQRTHGNACAQRMIAATAAYAPPRPARLRPRRAARQALQRLVGFEVELSVPTFGVGDATQFNPGPGGAPHALVPGLLTGGLDYDTQLGTLAPGIDLKTDHNRLKRTGAAIYAALQALQHNGQPLAVPGGYVEVSNLEYSTPALDELAPGSNAQFQAQANAIDAHTQQIFAANPDTQASPIPGVPVRYGTGLPLAQLRAWLGPALSADVNLLTALTNFASQIEWRMYVQATVGVLPTGMPGLFAARAAASPAGALRDAADAVVNGVQALQVDPLLAALPMFTTPGQTGQRDAFLGALHIGLSYAVGNALNKTDILKSTEKNAVPLLIKTQNIGAMTTGATTTRLRNHPPSAALIQNIATWFHANVPQTGVAYWTGNYNANLSPARDRLYGAGANPLQDTTDMLTRLLTGAGGVGAMRSGHALAGPDAPPASITPHIGGQQALPLEYRWIDTRPNAAGQLWALMQTVLAEARAANLATVPHLTAQAIRNAL